MGILRKASVVAFFFAIVTALVIARFTFGRIASAQRLSGEQVPTFEVDPLWPKPLPNHWILGQTIGVAVDARDHIWIVHRGDASLNIMTEGNNRSGPTWTITSDQPWLQLPGASRGGTGTGGLAIFITGAAPTQPATGHLTVTVTGASTLKEDPASCCKGAPPVLEFDQAGNLVSRLGGPGAGYDWPTANHGLTVDYKDNIWIGGNDPKDAHVLKFTRDGKFLLQVGHPGKNAGSNDTENFWRAAKVTVDPKMNEAYVADGYGNRRVAVIDADSGKFKRYWGAYGGKPDDAPMGAYDPDAPPARQFRSPVHCADISNDGLVYVCDRANNRIQVFQRDGTFVNETFIATPDARRRRRVGHRLLARSRAEVPVRGRRPQREGLHRAAKDDGGSHELRRRRPAARSVLRRPQHRDRFAGQRVHDRIVRGQASAEVREQGHGTGDEAGPGHALAAIRAQVRRVRRVRRVQGTSWRWPSSLIGVRATSVRRVRGSEAPRRQNNESTRLRPSGGDRRRARPRWPKPLCPSNSPRRPDRPSLNARRRR